MGDLSRRGMPRGATDRATSRLIGGRFWVLVFELAGAEKEHKALRICAACNHAAFSVSLPFIQRSKQTSHVARSTT